MKRYTPAIIAQTLIYLKENNIPLEKMVIQKLVHFLKDNTINIGVKFRPYLYGPYSEDLANELDEMVFWGEIKEHDKEYEIIDLPAEKYALPPEKQEKLIAGIDLFRKTVNDDFRFSNLELLGTMLHCFRAFEALGEDTPFDDVKVEFKKWKKNKFTEEEIRNAYDRIKATRKKAH